MGDTTEAAALRDCHVFAATEELLALKEQLYSRGNSRLRDVSRQRRTDGDSTGGLPQDAASVAGQWVAQLDAAGVDLAVVHCEAPTTRDFVHAVATFGGDRLQAFTNLDPLQTWSAEDLQKDVARGFVGLALLPTLQHFHAYDRRAYGLYEMCEQLCLPVAMHFGMTDSVFADMRFANPLDLQPVARDFPDVPFIVPSMGAGFLRELLMLMAQCHNVYADTSGLHLWLRCQPDRVDLTDVVSLLLDVGGPHRILYGSGSGDVTPLYRVDIKRIQTDLFADRPPDERRMIFGGTLTGLLGAINHERASQQRKSRLQLRRLTMR